MSTPMSLQSLQADMKIHYESGPFYESDSNDNRLLQLMPKGADGSGDTWKVFLKDGQIAGGSADPDISRTNVTPGSQIAWTGPYKNHYQNALVGDKALRMSAAPGGAFQPALELAMNSARDHFNDCTEFQMFRSEDGAIGQLSSGSANISITVGGAIFNSVTYDLFTGSFNTDTAPGAMMRLKTSGLVSSVPVGSVLVFSQPPGANSAAVVKAGAVVAGDWIVQSVQDTQFVAVRAQTAGTTMPSGSAFAYIKGDAQNGATIATSGDTCPGTLAGFESWIPLTNAAAIASFKGVDPSVNTQGRRGIRITSALNSSVNQSYINAGNKALQYSAKPSHIFCHPGKFSDLVTELVGQQRYLPQQGSAAQPAGSKGLKGKNAGRFGFDALVLSQYGTGKDLVIVPSWACHYNASWMVDLSKFKFETSPQGWPHVQGVGIDGQDWFRQTSSGNNWLLGLIGYGEVLCKDPSKQVAILHSNNTL